MTRNKKNGSTKRRLEILENRMQFLGASKNSRHSWYRQIQKIAEIEGTADRSRGLHHHSRTGHYSSGKKHLNCFFLYKFDKLVVCYQSSFSQLLYNFLKQLFFEKSSITIKVILYCFYNEFLKHMSATFCYNSLTLK